MTAILKVDTIQDTSGNNIINENANTITIGKSGDTVNLAAGSSLTSPGLTLSDNILFNTANKGIYLGVTSATASNLLDDYEEGTFTPTIEGSSTPGTATYSLQLGRYTKVGNKVTIQLQVNWSSGTGSGTAMYVKGLPFTQSSGFIQSLTIGFINNVTLASNTYAHANIANNNNYIRLFDEVVGGGATGDVAYDVAGEIGIGGTYIID